MSKTYLFHITITNTTITSNYKTKLLFTYVILNYKSMINCLVSKGHFLY